MSAAGRPAVFLDRDGVLTRASLRDGRPGPPWSLDQLEIVDGAAAACARLRAAGLPLIVVSNQPDVARGRLDAGVLDAINAELRRRVPVDDVLVCVHDDADHCRCRKPLPGMLLDAAARHGLAPERSVMVGDRWRDIDAGRAAGCRTVFVQSGDETPSPAADLVVPALADAVAWILETTAVTAQEVR